MKKIIVTTSWDDGHKLDVKLAQLLEKYKIKGTFYILQKHEKRTLSEEEVKLLGQNQEIGAHTISHPDLTTLNSFEAKKTIAGSKDYLENLLNKEIKMFCYPRGRFNKEVKDLVEKTGFLGARTTNNFQIQLPDDFFEFGTTCKIYPFPFQKKNSDHYLLPCLFEPFQQNYRQISKLKLSPKAFFSWTGLAKNLFDYVLKNGSIFHLWGHSWEIEKYGMWQDLEKILQYIADRKNVLYLTNGQTLESL